MWWKPILDKDNDDSVNFRIMVKNLNRMNVHRLTVNKEKPPGHVFVMHADVGITGKNHY